MELPLIGLIIVFVFGLWNLGYIAAQFRQTPLQQADWTGVLTAFLAVALAIELGVGFLVLVSCGPKDALFLKEDIGFLSFLRGLFGAPGGFAIVTGYKRLPTLLFAASLGAALVLGESLFSLLVWNRYKESVTTLMLVAGRAAAAAVFLRELAKLTSPKSAMAILERDARAPIMFLRAFSDYRVEMNKRSLFIYDRVLSVSINPTNFDQLLVLEFSAYGPVIAVGDPRGSTKTFGVYRDLLDDAEWRNYVRSNVIGAIAIVVVPDFSEGVRWELNLIKELNLLDKTLILAPSRYLAINANVRFWKWVGEALDIEIAPSTGKSQIGVYFEDTDQCILQSAKFRAESYRLALRHFFRFKRFKVFAG